MKNDSYQSSIDWLFHQFPAFQKQGAIAYHPTLDNVNALISYLDIDYTKEKFIHVAGTNGKGSTCAYIASMLMEQGFKVGLFSSPHLKDFRERIRINGKMINKDEVCNFIELIRTSKLPVQPSFFELTWVMALNHFTREKCDYIVVETGLGGRLDATNVITPILSVITNIGLDHQQILGHTKSEIAFEKAGIIKRNKPVLIGESDQSLVDIFKQKTREAQGMFFQLKERKESFLHQNQALARGVMYLMSELGEFGFNEQSVTEGVKHVTKNTGLKGRYQKISSCPDIIVDAAHNEDGVASLLSHVIAQNLPGNIHIVYGAANDKNVEEIVRSFPSQVKCYFTAFSHERSMNLSELKAKTNHLLQEKQYFQNEEDALRTAKSLVNKEDTILIFGSFFLIEKFL